MKQSRIMSVAGRMGTVAAVIFLSGCSGLKPPRFSVQTVTLTEQTAEGAVLQFTLEGENRNAEPLPLKEVEYTLWLDGREVFRGRRSAEVTLSKYSVQSLTLPVAITQADAAGALTGLTPYRIRGSVKYDNPGAVAETLADVGISRPSAAFTESGRLNFVEGPQR